MMAIKQRYGGMIAETLSEWSRCGGAVPVLVICLLVSMAGATAVEARLHVGPVGREEASGTPDDPFNSLSAALAAARAAEEPPSRIDVRAGVYDEDVLIDVEGLEIRGDSAGTIIMGTVTLAAADIHLWGNLTIESEGVALHITAEGASVTAQDLRLIGELVDEGTQSRMRWLTIMTRESRDTTAATLKGSATSFFDYNQIGAGFAKGVVVSADRIYLRDNEIDSTAEVAIVLDTTRDANVYRNIIRSAAAVGVRVLGEAELQGNEIEAAHAGVIVDGGPVRLVNNVVDVTDAGGAALTLKRGEQITADHNTLVAREGEALVITGTVAGALRNNIFAGQATGPVRPDLTLQFNVFSKGSDLSLAQEARRTASDNIMGEPEFVNPESGDYRLAPSSPAASVANVLDGVREDARKTGRGFAGLVSLGAYEVPDREGDGRTIRVEPGDDLKQLFAEALPGDRFELAAGEHRVSGELRIERSGTPDRPIRIEGEDAEAVIIRAADEPRYAWRVRGSYVQIADMTFQSLPEGGIIFERARDCILERVRVIDSSTVASGGQAIRMDVGCYNITVRDCLVDRTAIREERGEHFGRAYYNIGIQGHEYSQSHGHHILNNTVRGFYYAMQTGRGGRPISSTHWLVEGNLIEGNSDGFHDKGGFNVLRNNTFRNNRHGCWARSSRYTVYENNLFVDNEEGIWFWSGTRHVVRNNVFVNNTRAALRFGDGRRTFNMADIRILGNTIYNDVGHRGRNAHITVEENVTAANVLVMNNIFAGGEPIIRENGFIDAHMDHNLYEGGSYPSRLNRGGKHNRHGQARFVNPAELDFRLRADSDARGIGTPAGGLREDYAGNPRPARAIDAGAFQYVCSIEPD